MEEEKLYGCSIAPRIVNKNERDDQAAFKDGFKSGAVSVNQLKEFIKNGWAFSYAYKHDLRSSSNFIGTEILAADIDGGLSLEDALKHPLVKHSASFIYTTVNHQKNSPRFRVVFALAKPILDREELSQVTTAIAARLSGDMSATDPARIFYGSKGCEIFEIGNELTAEVVDELSAQGGELFRTTNHLLKGNSASVRSARLIPNDLMVKLKNSEIVSISTLNKKTTIFCPDHNDTHPSAFVGFSEKGSCFIYCHACQTTRWVKWEESRYDFNEFEKAAKKIAADEEYETKLVRGFAFYFEEKRKVGGRIYVSEKEKLSIDELREGITFVKSPKGSGKTTMLPEIFRDKAFRITGGSLSFEELEENEDPDCEPLYRVD